VVLKNDLSPLSYGLAFAGPARLYHMVDGGAMTFSTSRTGSQLGCLYDLMGDNAFADACIRTSWSIHIWWCPSEGCRAFAPRACFTSAQSERLVLVYSLQR
jgi:hypothetical protein